MRYKGKRRARKFKTNKRYYKRLGAPNYRKFRRGRYNKRRAPQKTSKYKRIRGLPQHNAYKRVYIRGSKIEKKSEL